MQGGGKRPKLKTAAKHSSTTSKIQSSPSCQCHMDLAMLFSKVKKTCTCTQDWHCCPLSKAHSYPGNPLVNFRDKGLCCSPLLLFPFCCPLDLRAIRSKKSASEWVEAVIKKWATLGWELVPRFNFGMCFPTP